MYLIGGITILSLLSFLLVFAILYLLLKKSKSKIVIMDRYLRFSIISTAIILASLISFTVIIISCAFYFGPGSMVVQLVYVIWIIILVLVSTKVLIPVETKNDIEYSQDLLQYKESKSILYLYGAIAVFIIIQYFLMDYYNIITIFLGLMLIAFLGFTLYKGLFRSKAIINNDQLKYRLNVFTNAKLEFKYINYIKLGKGFAQNDLIEIFYSVNDIYKEKLRISYIEGINNFIKELVKRSNNAEIDNEIRKIIND
ncbi:hypothetical protein [Natronospora cellulosivora (SeqCode)]